MGIVAGYLEERAYGDLSGFRDPKGWLIQYFGGSPTKAGITVNDRTALTYSLVFACIRKIAQTAGMLPFPTFNRVEWGGRERADTHELFKILDHKMNPEMTAMAGREAMTGHAVGWGNAFAEIQNDYLGRRIALWPIPPNRVTVERYRGQLVYDVQVGGVTKRLPRERMLHIPGYGWNGLQGYSVLDLARESIGLGLAYREYRARFFSNDARPGVALIHPKPLSPKARDNIKGSWENAYGGLENKHRVAILEEGIDLKEIGIPPSLAQFIEGQQFEAEDVPRWFDMPPHKVGILTHATYSNIEHQAIEFVQDTILPWLRRWEQGINVWLLGDEWPGVFVEHLVEGLLRGDTESRYKAYQAAIYAGFMTRSEVRQKENLPPKAGLDRPILPVNYMEVGESGEGRSVMLEGEDWRDVILGMLRKEFEGESLETGIRRLEEKARTGIRLLGLKEERRQGEEQIVAGRRRLRSQFRRLLLDAAQRVIRREVADVKRAVKKLLGKERHESGDWRLEVRQVDDFRKWVTEFYAGHGEFVQKQMGPVVSTYGEAFRDLIGAEVELPATDESLGLFLKDYTERYGERHVQSSLGQVEALIEETPGEELAEAVTTRMDEWDESRPGKVADDEKVRVGAAVTRFLYGLSGVTLLKVVNNPGACEFCQTLNGKTFAIGEPIVGDGQDLTANGKTLKVYGKKYHPPFHEACECDVVAA